MSARAPHGPSRHSEEGVALLLALLFIVLMTVLVVEFAYENQVESSFVDVRSAQFEAEVAARSAVAAGMGLLAADAQLASYAQTAVPSNLRDNSAIADALGGMADSDSLLDAWALGVPYRQINKAAMQCAISDEYGKLNLNALLLSAANEMYADSAWPDNQPPPSGTVPVNRYDGDSESLVPETENTVLVEALRSLFIARGAEEDPVDAILDWLDADDESRASGAENDVYGMLDVPYATKNAPFDSVEELLMVRGIPPEIFFGNPENDELPLTELLTVRGDPQGRINLNTAPPEILVAVGEALGQPGLAERVLEEREVNPIMDRQDAESRGLVEPTAEANDPNNRPRPNNPDNGGLDPNLDPTLAFQREPFVFSSRVFRIRGNGESGEVAVRVEAYVQRDASMAAGGYSGGDLGAGGLGGGMNPTNRGPTGEGGIAAEEALQNAGPSMFRILDWRIER